MRLTRIVWVAVVLFALAFGLLTLLTARGSPSGSFAGTSTVGGLAELVAGWSLVAAGVLFGVRHRRNPVGALLVLAGLAWFLPEWSNEGVGTSFGFTAGLIGFVLVPPLVGHAALAHPSGRLASKTAAAVVAVSYAGALLLLGVLPTTVFDPVQSECLQCPSNLALVHGDHGLYLSFNHYGLRIGLGWLCALGALVAWQLVRSSRTTLLVRGPVLASTLAYLGLVALDFQQSFGHEQISVDSFDIRMWRYEAAALTALALAVGVALLRELRARSTVARFVVEMGRSPRPGGVRDAVAQALGDPTLELAYRRAHSGLYVDALGEPVLVDDSPGRTVTPLLRGGEQFAALAHDSRLLADPGLLENVLVGSRLAVENEQLQAEVRAQLRDLRTSRARIVETGDAERKRLERDLHDGAQQRIVALTLGLQLLSAQGESARLDEAREELRLALGELRELAHGIYPAVLADEGLAAAVEALAERPSPAIRIETLTEGRFAEAVESTAYFAVAESVKGADAATVRIDRANGTMTVRVERSPGPADSDREARFVEIADRVGALEGRFEASAELVQAEIPCA
jgi:signal transduction histidine kinase